jgi:hypothetical protein
VKSTTLPSRFVDIVLRCTANHCKQIAAVVTATDQALSISLFLN